MDIEKEISQIKSLGTMLNEYDEVINKNSIANLKKIARDIQEKIENIRKENRLFKIGVVGQVKAGKSSFLNALIFDGKNFLPKAATPMTAALTVIKYSAENFAEIEFYSEDDWEIIIDNNNKYNDLIEKEYKKELKKYNESENRIKIIKPTKENIVQRNVIPEEYKAAHELYIMYSSDNSLGREFFGKKEKIIINDIENLKWKLEEYIGANGKYTPIVKCMTLNINIKELENIEIVDTPGTNDPIISRGMRTRDFLYQCDYVLMMSYAGQFLDSEDIAFLMEKLPAEGVKNMLLLGTKFDTILLQQNNLYDGNIIKAYIEEKKKLIKRAENIIGDAKRNEFANMQSKIELIEKALPPHFVSSVAYQIYKNYDNLDEEEKNIYTQLKRDYYNSEITKEILENLSFINHIKCNNFKEIISKKDNYMKEKLINLISGQKNYIMEIISNIVIELKEELEILENSEKNELEKKYKDIIDKINHAKLEIEYVFSNSKNAMKREFKNAKSELKENSITCTQITVYQDTKIEEEIIERGWGFRLKFWPHEEIREKRVHYNYANIYEAIEKIDRFVIEVERAIIRAAERIFNKKQLSIDLKNSILSCFDISEATFDERAIIIPVQKTIDSISIPDIDFESQKYKNKILNKFNSGRVENKQLDELIRVQYDIINEILNDLQNEFNSYGTMVNESLEISERDFINNLNKNFEERLSKISNMLEKREENKAKIKEVLKKIEEISF